MTASFKNNLIGDRGFYRRVVAILLPIVVQNTVTNVVSLIDNVMVGAVGTLQMSAVAIVNQLLFIFNLCIFGGLSGAGIFSAQYAGAGDHRGVRHCFRTKLYIALAMVVLALAVFTIFPDALISMYLSSDTDPAEAASTLGFAKDYLAVMLIGILPFALSQAYGSTLRELGETRVPMIASVSGIVINLCFNYLFIFGNEGLPFLPFAPMGVTGAAIATVMSRFAEMAIIVIYVHKKSERFLFIKGAYKSFRVPAELLSGIGKKGMPLLINEFLWSLGMAMINQCYSLRGLEVVAATNIASTAYNLFNVVFISMGNAVAIMAGQCLGGGRFKEAKVTVWRLITLAVASCAVMGGLLALAAPLIPELYNTTETVKSTATGLLYVISVFMPFFAFTHCCYFAMRSGGRTLITFAFDSGFTWGGCFVMAFVLSRFTSLPVVPMYFCVQALEVLKVTVGFILVKKGVWLNNIVEKD